MTRERRGEWELGRLGRKSQRAMGAPSTCGLSAPDLSRAVCVASPRIVFAITPCSVPVTHLGPPMKTLKHFSPVRPILDPFY